MYSIASPPTVVIIITINLITFCIIVFIARLILLSDINEKISFLKAELEEEKVKEKQNKDLKFSKQADVYYKNAFDWLEEKVGNCRDLDDKFDKLKGEFDEFRDEAEGLIYKIKQTQSGENLLGKVKSLIIKELGKIAKE